MSEKRSVYRHFSICKGYKKYVLRLQIIRVTVTKSTCQFIVFEAVKAPQHQVFAVIRDLYQRLQKVRVKVTKSTYRAAGQDLRHCGK